MRYLAVLLMLAVLQVQAGEAGDELRVHVDLGAVVAAGEVSPVQGITSAGQPDEAALQVFADSGYSTVIDLRGPGEDRGMPNYAGVVEAKGLDYIAFPLTRAADFTLERAAELDRILESTDGPVLLHCASGNRVGAILALRESLRGAAADAAIEYGRRAGMTRLEPTIRKVLEERPPGD